MVRGLFLDLDGTLADSMPAMREAYRRVLAAYGREGTDAEFHSLNGPPLPVVVERLRAAHQISQTATDILATYRQIIAGCYQLVLPAVGAGELLSFARKRAWRNAVVTSTAHAAADHWLTANGLRDAVDVIVGGDEVSHGKPAADPYLMALDRAGCRPAGAIAIEDSPQGAASAIAAGIRTYGLAGPGADPSSWPAVAGFLPNLRSAASLIDA